MTDLSGRTALVTGASRGIGEACARALAAAGAHVALAARSKDQLEGVAASLPNDAVVLPIDLGQPDAAENLAREAIGALGRVDILVNNAGMAIYSASRNLTDAEVEPLLALNVKAAMVLAGRLGGHMADSGGGSIVNMSSVAGMLGVAHQHAYAASKGAMDAMTRSMAAEFGPKGVRVNAVNPGVIMTDMWAVGIEFPGVRDKVIAGTALRRLGQPEDIADAVVFLASDASRFITGQSLAVDGGIVGFAPDLLPRLE